MSNRAWMPLHIDDYIRDTDHLSATEHGAYFLLIMKYWRDGGLPTDEVLIRRYAKLSPEQWAESRDVLAALFDDNWRHKRIDAELQKAAEIIEKRRAAGKGTQFNGKSPANAKQMPEHVSDKSTAPLTSNQVQKEEPNGSSKKRDDEFDEWYRHYPHKVQRGAAEKAFLKARSLASLEELIAGTQRYVASKPADYAWRNPATWLNGKGWLDAPAPQPRPNSTAPPGRMTPTDANQYLTEREHERQAQRDNEIVGILRSGGGDQPGRADSLIRGAVNRAFD